jgi:hypothetical protein
MTLKRIQYVIYFYLNVMSDFGFKDLNFVHDYVLHLVHSINIQ